MTIPSSLSQNLLTSNSKMNMFYSFMLFLFLNAIFISSQAQTTVTFDVPGTYSWTVPPCVTSITVKAYGGGGGGGGVASRNNAGSMNPDSEACSAGGGGGGGSYTERTYTVVPGETYTIVVGAGGGAGIGNSASSAACNGAAGGNSTFSGSATIAPGTLTAWGGQLGSGARTLNNSSDSHTGTNGSGGAGGSSVGTNGTFSIAGGSGATGKHDGSCHDQSGGGGGCAGANATILACWGNQNGGAGANGGGNGGNGRQGPLNSSYTGYNGNNGNIIGGGGSGALIHMHDWYNSWKTNNGGSGMRGEVRITYSSSVPTAMASNTGPVCAGTAVTLNAGPNGMNSYSWSGPSFGSSAQNPIINPAVAGTYTVTITDASSCTATASTTVVVNPAPTVNAGTDENICAGQSVTLTGSGATSYVWDNGVTNGAAFTPATTTTYTVTGTSSGCSNTDQVVVNVSPIVTPTFTPVAAICSGGSLSALPTTSTNGITGTWSPALNNTTTTTYAFTPTAGQCATTTSMTITVDPLVTPNFTPVADICSGGTLSALPTTSTNGITGTWAPALNNTATTTYTFTPTAGLCATTTTLTITVNPTTAPVTGFTYPTPVCQTGGNIFPTPAAGFTSGGVISGSAGLSINTTTGEINVAASSVGTHTATYTVAATGCSPAGSSSFSITINTPTTPTFTLVAAICSGGTLSALPTTSTNGITGTWSPALNNTATTTYTFTPTVGQCATTTSMTITVNPLVTPTFAPVAAICSGGTLSALPTTSTNGITGTWSPALNNTATTTYTFTPSAGQCATTTTMTITVNPLVTPTFTPVAAICSGGTLSALPTTSTNGITGTWAPALNNTATTTYTFTPTAGQCATTATMIITVNPLVTPTFTSVAAICSGSSLSVLPTTSTNGITGTWSPALNNTATTTYTFTPTAGQCATTTSMTITIYPALSASAVATDALCYGASTGSIDLTVSGGTSPFTYAWTNGAGTSEDPINLPANSYSVVVTDAHACTASTSATVGQPNDLQISLVSTINTLCGNQVGAIDIQVTGGTAAYAFDWSHDGTGDNDDTEDISNLYSGTYNVTVSDLHLCTESFWVTITDDSNFSASIPTFQNVTCFGASDGQLTLSISAGTSPYQYSIDNGATWLSATNGMNINNLTAGAVNVKVRDANGCLTTATQTLSEPAILNVSAVATPASCNATATGSIQLTVTGGTPNYSYTWTGGIGNVEDPSGLVAAMYSVTVNDAQGCSYITSATVTEPAPLDITGTPNDVLCNGGSNGSIDITVSGGTPPYSYTWDHSAGSVEDPSNLNANNYTVVVNDANACQISDSYLVDQPVAIVYTEYQSVCSGQSYTFPDGVTLNNVISDAVYVSSLSNAAGCDSTVTTHLHAVPTIDYNTYANVCYGQTYTFADGSSQVITSTMSHASNLVSDLGCDSIIHTFVTMLPNPSPSITGNDFCQGSLSTLSAGNFSQYLWSSNQTSSQIQVSTGGMYSVTVTASNGCTATDDILVEMYPNPVPTIVGDTVICAGEASNLSVNLNGMSYMWSTMQSTQSINIQNAGMYYVTVTDGNGCQAVRSRELVVNPLPQPIISGQMSMCMGTYTTISLDQSYFHQVWNTGEQAQSITVINAGTYTVSVTDINGCTNYALAVVNEMLVALNPMQNQNICNGRSAALNVTVLNGTPPYTYLWDNGVTTATQQVTPLVNTTYTVTVTDANGCLSAPASVTINVTDQVDLVAVAEKDSVCPGENVRINIQIIGGVYPYLISNTNSLTTSQNYDIVNINQDVNILYTVVDACGSTDAQMVEIGVFPTPEPNLISNVISGCEPLAIQFTDLQSHGTYYYWDFGDSQIGVSGIGSISHTYMHAGLYDVSLTVTSPKGCKTTGVYNDLIHVYPNPDASFVADCYETTYLDGRINFSNTSTFNYKNIWSFGDGDSSNAVSPSHFYSTIGYYWVMLNVETNFGCTDSALQRIRISDEFVFYAPNVFTPGYDGLNDYFYPFASGIETEKGFVFTVYDRWGMLIYRSEKVPYQTTMSGKEFRVRGSESEQFGWNGRFMNTGEYVKTDVYHWTIRLLDTEGVPHEYEGSVNVIR